MIQFKESIASVGAARVRWRRAGRGPVLVFLPGFPLAGETWDAVIAALAERFSCITFDLVGLGGSTSTIAEHFCSPGQARAFQAVLAQLGVSSCALVGNDTGGWTCYLAMDEVHGDVWLWELFPSRIALRDDAGEVRAREGVLACAPYRS